MDKRCSQLVEDTVAPAWLKKINKLYAKCFVVSHRSLVSFNGMLLPMVASKLLFLPLHRVILKQCIGNHSSVLGNLFELRIFRFSFVNSVLVVDNSLMKFTLQLCDRVLAKRLKYRGMSMNIFLLFVKTCKDKNV